jgi:hypothetical protein
MYASWSFRCITLRQWSYVPSVRWKRLEFILQDLIFFMQTLTPPPKKKVCYFSVRFNEIKYSSLVYELRNSPPYNSKHSHMQHTLNVTCHWVHSFDFILQTDQFLFEAPALWKDWCWYIPCFTLWVDHYYNSPTCQNFWSCNSSCVETSWCSTVVFLHYQVGWWNHMAYI